MMLILQWKFSILDPNIRIIRIHIFLILVVLIYDITTVIYQYCNGLSDENIVVERPGTSSIVPIYK